MKTPCFHAHCIAAEGMVRYTPKQFINPMLKVASDYGTRRY